MHFRWSLLWCCAAAAALPLPREELVQQAARRGDGTWAKITATPPRNVSSRELFAYALALCEANHDLDRLPRLIEVAGGLQETRPEVRGYGNFRWESDEAEVLDYNAVDFCMQSGAILWQRHRDKFDPATLTRFRAILDLAVVGLQRHRVNPNYTNIALMNAFCLIALGEGLEQPPVADEGYRRLEGVVFYTWQNGIHEYGSPTYYGVDLEDLMQLEAFCRRDEGRQMARALLELFWTDLAVNWYEPADKLAGARSRDYDYLRGLGMLDQAIWLAGWLKTGTPGFGPTLLYHLYSDWTPPARLRELNATYPRYVRQKYGPARAEARTHLVLEDITLSCAASGYGNMDLPLSFDYPGERTGIRGYYIPDGRLDPYGKARIPSGGGHDKTIHLSPLWTAAQNRRDALGLAIYRQEDLKNVSETVRTHFVLPRKNDGLWVGERPVEVTGQPWTVDVPAGAAVVIRLGSAAVGLQVPWATGHGQPAKIQLIDDGNPFGALRLTVEHVGLTADTTVTQKVGAALWVRVGSRLDEAGLAAFRQAFGAARARVVNSPEAVTVAVDGLDGPVSVNLVAPWRSPGPLLPEPTDGLLELNGVELGQPLLAALPPIARYTAEMARLQPLAVPATGDFVWEAATGAVLWPMVRAEDGSIWSPGEPGEGGGGAGGALWRLKLERPRRVYLWLRTLAPTPDDDSFYLAIDGPTGAILPRCDWPVGVQPTFTWVALGGGRPEALDLPAGEITIRLDVRENGTKADRLALTDQPRQP